jgi:hypothetical protein
MGVMAFSLACPHCGAVLKSAAPVPAGKRVKCAKCGSAFDAPPLEDATAVTTTASPRAASRRSDAEPRADEPSARDDDEPRPRDRDRDDDDDESRPARKLKRKKGGMGVGMLIGLLLVGGVMLVVGCSGCGGLGYWIYYLSTKSPIVGTWEQLNHPLGIKAVNTFESNGLGNVKLGNVMISYKYRLEGNQLTIEPVQAMGGVLKGINPVERYTVAFNNNEMTLTPVNNQLFMAGQQRFRRIN